MIGDRQSFLKTVDERQASAGAVRNFFLSQSGCVLGQDGLAPSMWRVQGDL